jgi:hypothetical protein
VGASTVPGYYSPADKKYFESHPREQFRTQPPGFGQDIETNPAAEPFRGYKRDLEKQDVDRWEARRQIRLQQSYDEWLSRRFNITNPHVARWLRTIEPEFWDRRWAFLKDKMDVETFLTRMRLYGPQTIEDFEGLYALHNDAGMVDATERPSRNLGRNAGYLTRTYREGRVAMGRNMIPRGQNNRAPRYPSNIMPEDGKAIQY